MLKAKGSTGGNVSTSSQASGFVPGERSPQPITQFNYGAIERPVMDDEDAVRVAMREQLQRVLQAVCEWLYPPRCRPTTVALRANVFIWFLRPEWLGNPSQVELAERLEMSKQRLGTMINKWRKTFGFYVAGMRGDEAREKFAQHAKRHATELAAARRKAAAKKTGRIG